MSEIAKTLCRTCCAIIVTKDDTFSAFDAVILEDTNEYPLQVMIRDLTGIEVNISTINAILSIQ